ncbi:MAG: hypothetical protein AAFY27_06250 [Pseudomonadota bacterium]
MVLLGFQKQFAADVEALVKRQTIRAPRKDGRDPKVGDRLQLYTGLRTKACRKLVANDPIVKSVQPIVVSRFGLVIDRKPVTDADTVARADGFEDFEAMANWFKLTHDDDFFHGLLIKW